MQWCLYIFLCPEMFSGPQILCLSATKEETKPDVAEEGDREMPCLQARVGDVEHAYSVSVANTHILDYA